MKMKVYEYYSTDINNQNLYYTACTEDFDLSNCHVNMGKIFEAEMPEGVHIGRLGSGQQSLIDGKGRALYIHRRKDGTAYLISTFAVQEMGCEWHEAILYSIILKEC